MSKHVAKLSSKKNSNRTNKQDRQLERPDWLYKGRKRSFLKRTTTWLMNITIQPKMISSHAWPIGKVHSKMLRLKPFLLTSMLFIPIYGRFATNLPAISMQSLRVCSADIRPNCVRSKIPLLSRKRLRCLRKNLHSNVRLKKHLPPLKLKMNPRRLRVLVQQLHSNKKPFPTLLTLETIY